MGEITTMPQSLTQLPQTAEFVICGERIQIKDHRVVNYNYSLLGAIIRIARHNRIIGKNSLQQFEEHGINLDVAIEECVYDIENNQAALAYAVYWSNDIFKLRTVIHIYTEKEPYNFMASGAGRNIATLYTDAVRECDNWEDLHDLLNFKSSFQNEMSDRILKEMVYCRKV